MHEQIHTDASFSSSSPYSQAIRDGDLIFVSGQVPVDVDGNIVGTDIAGQTTQVLDNIEAILDAGGSSMGQLLKTTVFLTDIQDFAGFNEVYEARIPDPKPARSAVEVSNLAIDVKVEVEAIASVSD